MDKNCENCKHFEDCYPMVWGSDIAWTTPKKQFNAIRQRDLCTNNNKNKYEDK